MPRYARRLPSRGSDKRGAGAAPTPPRRKPVTAAPRRPPASPRRPPADQAEEEPVGPICCICVLRREGESARDALAETPPDPHLLREAPPPSLPPAVTAGAIFRPAGGGRNGYRGACAASSRAASPAQGGPRIPPRISAGTPSLPPGPRSVSSPAAPRLRRRPGRPPPPPAALTPALSRAPQELSAVGVVDELPPLGHALAEGLLRFLGHGEARSGCVAHPGDRAPQAEKAAASARSQPLSNCRRGARRESGRGRSLPGPAQPHRTGPPRREAGLAATPFRPRQPIPARRAPAPWRPAPRPRAGTRRCLASAPAPRAAADGAGGARGLRERPVPLRGAGGGRGGGAGGCGAPPAVPSRFGPAARGYGRRRRDMAISGEGDVPRRGSRPKWHLRLPRPAAFRPPADSSAGVSPQPPRRARGAAAQPGGSVGQPARAEAVPLFPFPAPQSVIGDTVVYLKD